MKSFRRFHWIRIGATFLFLSALTGCTYVESLTGRTSLPSTSASTPASTPNVSGARTTSGTPAGKPLSPMASTTKSPSSTAYTPLPMGPVFYDFSDIPTPQELSLVHGDSYVLEVGSAKAGLLVLKGRVEPNSVMRFFDAALPREHWIKKGSLRYQRSVLIFEKPDKGCIINIYERNFATNVEIYVIPYQQQQQQP